MKRVLVIFTLLAFVGVYGVPALTLPKDAAVKVVAVDKDKKVKTSKAGNQKACCEAKSACCEIKNGTCCGVKMNSCCGRPTTGCCTGSEKCSGTCTPACKETCDKKCEGKAACKKK